MHSVDILLTSDLPGGTEPHLHGNLDVAFHRWTGTGNVPSVTGLVWAFVDWILPETSGIQICRRLRAEPSTAQAHITVVIGDDREARRQALRGGADDYVVGPLDRCTVLDRVLSLNARSEANGMRRTLKLADLTIDLTAFQARWQDKPLPLGPNEFRLLRYFVEHPGRVFTRPQLIAALGKQEAPIDERTVDVWIGRLRRALRAANAAGPLRTVRTLGYVFDMP